MLPKHISDRDHPQNNGRAEDERAIFRDEARRNYIQREEKIELPAAVSPKFFVSLWMVTLALLVVGLIVTFWPLIRQW